MDQTLVQACNADPATAGFIPMRVTVISTTQQFTEDAAASFHLSTSPDMEPNFPGGVSWVANFSDGPTCDDASTADHEPWTITYNQVAPGGTVATSGGLLVSNWKSPNFPDGDPAYTKLWLGQADISGAYNVAVNWTATSAEGAGVVDTNSPSDNLNFCRWYLPINAG